MRALLEHRNTPDPETGMSPAQIVFGRQLRGFLPRPEAGLSVREEWKLGAERRAAAHAKRQARMQEQLSSGARQLEPLQVGQEVVIQGPPAGGKHGKWDKSGTVVEVLPFDAYSVRVHGSRLLTKRNRSHLRKIEPFVPEERIYPVTSPAASLAPRETVTEVTDRYVAVQPPRVWNKLSPVVHRKEPVGRPGEDIITRLKEAESGSTRSGGR